MSRLPRSRWEGSSTSALAITKSYLSAASAGSNPRGVGPACASMTGAAPAGAASVAPAASVPEARKSRRERSMNVLLFSAEAEHHVRGTHEAQRGDEDDEHDGHVDDRHRVDRIDRP